MRFRFVASFGLFAVLAVACGGDQFAPAVAGGAGSGDAGTGGAMSGRGGASTGGSSTGGTSGAGAAGTGGSAGTSSAGAAGSVTAMPCITGADCGKADLCKGIPYCSNNTCFLDTSAVPVIEDNNPCTKDTCNATTGLSSHTNIPVGDGNPCTKDSCDPITGFAHVKDDTCTGCESAEECDDGDPCTEEACTNTECSYLPKAVGTACGEGDACTGAAACDAAGACVPTPPKVVDDGDECTVDSCDPVTGEVKHTALLVDDGSACTKDSCDPAKGLIHVNISVDDGDACTKDACDPKTGVTHDPIDPGDGDLCTVDTCDPKKGPQHTLEASCDHTCKSEKDCSDGIPCTKDVCTLGVCSNPSDEGAVCNDGLFCTVGDTCADSKCKGGGPPVVSDDDLCTVDTCDDEKDAILHTPKDITVGGTACTQNSCGKDGVIVHTTKENCCLNSIDCNLLVPASAPGICRKPGGKCEANNTCTKNVETKIDDGNKCTTDKCDAATGIVTHTISANVQGCCVKNEQCLGGERDGVCFAPGTCNLGTGACVAGTATKISDGIECTVDTCDPKTGLVTNASVPGKQCCKLPTDCPKGGVSGDGQVCTAESTCGLDGVCTTLSSPSTRPSADSDCTSYVCSPDGSWAMCCLDGKGNGLCPLCLLPNPDICGTKPGQ